MVSLPRERDNVVFDDERLLEVGRRVLRMEAEEIARAAARVGRELVGRPGSSAGARGGWWWSGWASRGSSAAK